MPFDWYHPAATLYEIPRRAMGDPRLGLGTVTALACSTAALWAPQQLAAATNRPPRSKGPAGMVWQAA